MAQAGRDLLSRVKQLFLQRPGGTRFSHPFGARTFVRTISALPQSREANVIGHQVLRSGTSIGANYAEADSARSRAEFAAKVGDSLKEASETVYWLELLAEAEIVDPAKLTELLKEAGELKSILASIYNKTKA